MHPPKPTDYRGIQYRSRTEAKWAVLLDHHPEVLAFKYEPFALKTPINAYAYIPDFIYLTKGGKLGLIEVKPARPTEEYIRHLESLAHYIPNTVADFVIGIAGFYEVLEPQFYDLFLHGEPTNHFLIKYDQPVQEASHYRFDLISFLGPSEKQSERAYHLLDACYRDDKKVNLKSIIKKWLEKQ